MKALPKIAVIDIGSNSVRLVVYDSLRRTALPLFNEKVLCGLARDMEHTRRLNKEGVAQAYATLDRFMMLIKAMHVRTILTFATSAVRDSEDGKEFIATLKKRYKLDVRLLSGEEEAKYAAFGVSSSFYHACGLIGDLGGGSLELAAITCQDEEKAVCEIRNAISFPIGALRLQTLAGGIKSKASTIIDGYLEQFSGSKENNFYAVGGGFRALAKIHIAQKKYPLNVLHYYKAPAKELLATARQVSDASVREIQKLGAISERRAQTLAFSALVMERVITRFKPRTIIFSAHGVREGMLFDQLPAEEKAEDALMSGCIGMIRNISPGSRQTWVDFGHELNAWMSPLFKKETPAIARLRHAACILSRLAWDEHTAYRAEMAFRWVLDAELSAIDHQERAFVATSIFYRYNSSARANISRRMHALLNSELIYRAKVIGQTMRLGYQISAGTTGILPHTPIRATETTLLLQPEADHAMLISDSIRSRLQKLARLMRLRLSM